MPEAVTFTVALPPACLSPNNRAHWRTKNKAKQEYAEIVWLAGQQARYRQHTDRLTMDVTWKSLRNWVPWAAADVHLVWCSTHHKDVDNIIAHLKGLIDGLSTKGTRPLGLFEDDKNITVTAEWRRERVRANGRVEVTITRRTE